MFYHWLETQRAWMRSVDAWTALAAASWGALPACAHAADTSQSSEARLAAAPPGCDWVFRLLQAAREPPPFAIDSVQIEGRSVPVVETVVDRTAFCALRRFARQFDVPAAAPRTGERQRGAHRTTSARRIDKSTSRGGARLSHDAANGTGRPSVLLVAPLAGHHAVMLRETVQTLLEDADVYVTDWANARDVPLAHGRFDLDDYVLAVERFLRPLAPGGVHVLAICQAAPPALAAAALAATANDGSAPLSVTLMGGPIDTRSHPTMIDRVAATHDVEWFRRTVIDTVPPGYPGAGRRIYPGYLQHAAIVAAHPHRQWGLETQYWASRFSGSAAAIASSQRALDEYCSVLDMDEDYFLDTLCTVFQEQRLARGSWSVGERRVRPEALTATALCTVEGDRDDIAGTGQTHAAHGLCVAVADAERMCLTVDDCDHYDLFTGPRWREVIHPALRRFWLANERDRSPPFFLEPKR
jgi:poly(3-hydroxybutyrate) depolymerase